MSLPTSSFVSFRACVALVALAVALLACASNTGPGATLYARLGGEPGVAAIVDRTIDRSVADPRTRRSFVDIKLRTLKDSIAQQICSISGGGCKYEGETMARAHKDARITAAEFDAMVTILREELDRQGVDAGAKNELLRLLAPMKRDVVAGEASAAAASQPAPAARN